MIRTEKEYQRAAKELENQERMISENRQRLQELKLTPEQQKRAMGPLLTWHLGLKEDVEWYQRVKKGDFKPVTDLTVIGRTLIALRIASGLSQKDLADKLEVPESQISRYERNEYRGISMERVQKIVSAMGANLKVNFDLGHKRAA